jgi:large subunit ribosomal protein L4
MQVNSYRIDGQEGEKVTLPKALFGEKVDPRILAQAVRVYLANQRTGSAKTKTRGEVEGSTRKIFRQKGTGRARHGSVRAPIFVGGGISHGPDGAQNWKLRMSAPMKRKALVGAMGKLAEKRSVAVLTGGGDGKTKSAALLMEKLGWEGKTVVLVGTKENEVGRQWRNLAGVEVARVNTLNAYLLLTAKELMVTSQALAELEKIYVN